MLLAGSRTPLIALLFVLVLHQYYMLGKLAATLMMAALFLVLGLSYFIIGGYIFETGFYSLFDRIEILSSINEVGSLPLLGFGVGSFGIVTTGIDFMFYPHNIFFLNRAYWALLL
jgi:hypothetical protein